MSVIVDSFMSRHAGKWLLLLASVLALFMAACQGEAATADAEELVYQQYNTGYGFAMLYPQTWTSSLLRQGLMAFGESEDVAASTAAGSAAETVVVFRRDPQGYASLEEEFTRYVEGGPEASGFLIADGIRETSLDDRPAFEVMVKTDPELVESEDRPDTTLYIIAAYADNGVTYYVTATAPTAEWETMWPIYQIMIASFEILE